MDSYSNKAIFVPINKKKILSVTGLLSYVCILFFVTKETLFVKNDKMSYICPSFLTLPTNEIPACI